MNLRWIEPGWRTAGLLAAAGATATLLGCTTRGSGTGSVSPGNAPVAFAWTSKGGGITGTMSATVDKAAAFAGPFLQVTQTVRTDAFEPMWTGWSRGSTGLVRRAARVMAIILATGVLSMAAAPGPATAAPPASAGPTGPAAAVAQTCFACHGQHGEGAAGIPRLAGLNAQYLGNALSMFKAGTRASPIMQPIAQSLDDAEIKGLADYFSRQSAPLANAGPRAPAAVVLAGQQLAEHGAGNVAACFSCHAAGGRENGPHLPAIAGQSAQYLVDRLHAFQSRAKAKPAPPGSMTAVAAMMNETQIAAAAAYLSQLAP